MFYPVQHHCVGNLWECPPPPPCPPRGHIFMVPQGLLAGIVTTYDIQGMTWFLCGIIQTFCLVEYPGDSTGAAFAGHLHVELVSLDGKSQVQVTSRGTGHVWGSSFVQDKLIVRLNWLKGRIFVKNNEGNEDDVSARQLVSGGQQFPVQQKWLKIENNLQSKGLYRYIEMPLGTGKHQE